MEDFWERIDACLFDLDGVLTPTADLHRRAWAELFDRFLESHPTPRPYGDADYYQLIDGRRRYDGVRAFLASRGLDLPPGDPSDPGSLTSVCGLGNLKDAFFRRLLDTDPIKAYPGSVALVETLARRGVSMAVVSASNNARQVLSSAGLIGCFRVVVDGHVAADLGLAGKPAPDTYLAAAAQLDVTPAHAAVVEDALGGVAAGRAGGFSPVIGVDRGAGHEHLRTAGADIVVDDLAELADSFRPREPMTDHVPPSERRIGRSSSPTTTAVGAFGTDMAASEED